MSYCITQILFVLTLHTFSITTFQTINLTGSNRSRTLLFVLLLRFLNPHISLPFSNLSTGLMSTNALNINFFLLPTKFLQPVNLAILTIWSLFSVQPPRSTRSSSVVIGLPFLTHQPSPYWKSQIAHLDMHHVVFGINFQIYFFSLISPVSIHFLIYLSTHPCHNRNSQHPSILHSRLKTYLFNNSFPP